VFWQFFLIFNFFGYSIFQNSREFVTELFFSKSIFCNMAKIFHQKKFIRELSGFFSFFSYLLVAELGIIHNTV